jgi:hypothetical protein
VRVFRRDETSTPGPGAGDGLTVVRFDVPLDRKLVLRVEHGGAMYELYPAESEDAADFLVPDALLDGTLTLLADGAELRDARRTASPVSAPDAYLAVQELLAEEMRRVEGLRRDLRHERERLDDETQPAAPDSSREVERLRKQLASAERELDEVDEKRAALAAELAEARAALREERASDEPPPRVAPG